MNDKKGQKSDEKRQNNFNEKYKDYQQQCEDMMSKLVTM